MTEDKLIDRRKRPIFIHSNLDEIPLTMEAFRVYCHLARRADVEGKSFPSYRRIGECCFRGSYPKSESDSLRRKAISAVAELIDWNLIEKRSRPPKADGSQTSNLFILTDESEWKDSISSTPENARKARQYKPRGKKGSDGDSPPSDGDSLGGGSDGDSPPSDGDSLGGDGGSPLSKSIEINPDQVNPLSPLTPQRGEEGVHESKADDFQQEQEEGETVVFEAEIVTEEEIKNKIDPSVENGKLAIRSINSNPGGDLDCAPACDNNPGLQRIIDAIESGRVTNLPPHDLKKLADYRLGNLVGLYRKSGNIYNTHRNDIKPEFLAYVEQKYLSREARNKVNAGGRIKNLEENPRRWGQLEDMVKGWLKQEYQNLGQPTQTPKEKHQTQEELRKMMLSTRI